MEEEVEWENTKMKKELKMVKEKNAEINNKMVLGAQWPTHHTTEL